MTRSKLIERLGSQFPQLSALELEKIVKAIFMQLAIAMGQGKRVEIRGFGTFSLRFKNARLARNPKTGQRVQQPARYTPYFRAGKELRDRVNHPDIPLQGAA